MGLTCSDGEPVLKDDNRQETVNKDTEYINKKWAMSETGVALSTELELGERSRR